VAAGLSGVILVLGGVTMKPVPARAVPPGAAAAPERLSETGLYDDGGRVDTRNLAFVPQYPLWSDGAAKSRWIYLPPGATIDVSDIDAWQFPVGTKLWKEFAWAGRRVETRMIWKSATDTWVFATYVWNDEQTEARLAPEDGVPDVVEIAPGKRHSIPGVNDCRSCHQSSPAVVLGFNALQLSDDRDPLAPHREPDRPGAVTLKTLVKANQLRPERPDLVVRPPRIRASDPTARAAMGYLSSNCGGCHNSRGPLARLGLNLLHNVGGHDGAPEPAMLTTINSRGRFVVPGVAPDSSSLISPGAPARSALLYRMKSRRPSSQMPPLGTLVADDAAVALVRSWVESLEETPVP
jgi:mono/diheme cytochrome c family protein